MQEADTPQIFFNSKNRFSEKPSLDRNGQFTKSGQVENDGFGSLDRDTSLINRFEAVFNPLLFIPQDHGQPVERVNDAGVIFIFQLGN